MNRPRTASASLLVLGAACLGAACGAPPSPETQGGAQNTDAQTSTAGDTADQARTYPPPPPAADASAPAPSTSPPPRERPVPARPQSPPPAREIPQPQPVPAPSAPPAQADATQPATMTVTMLSRGKGVPEATRAAYRDIRATLETQQKAYAVTGMRSQRIGLEGETRLCVQFRSAQDAQAAYDRIRKRASGIELLDVALAPCPSPKDYTP